MRTDVHQHLWTESLVEALAGRHEFPFVSRENGLAVLYLPDERPYVMTWPPRRRPRAPRWWRATASTAHCCASRARSASNGCRGGRRIRSSTPITAVLGARRAIRGLGSVPLRRPDPDDVDHALEHGCVGISLPAGALAGVAAVSRMEALLDRLERRGAPLSCTPDPGPIGVPGMARGRSPSGIRSGGRR